MNLKLEYTLDESDYLMHQLFIASISERIKKLRFRARIIVPLLYIALGIILWEPDKGVFPVMLVVVGVLWFFVYPLWQKRRYKKHYAGFIREHYQSRFGKTVTIEFNDEFVFTKEAGIEGKVMNSEIVRIDEIPSLILVRIGSGQSFLLPKNKINDLNNVKQQLKAFAAQLKVEYAVHDDWKWK